MAGRPKRAALKGKSDKPQACGTRKGNGMGWGGAASGKPASAKPAAEFGSAEQHPPGRPVGHSLDPFDKAWEQAKLADHRLRMAGFAEDEANSPELRIMAGERLSDRIEGKPVQKQEITGKDGGAVKTESVNWDALPTEQLRAIERAYRAAMIAQDTNDEEKLD